MAPRDQPGWSPVSIVSSHSPSAYRHPCACRISGQWRLVASEQIASPTRGTLSAALVAALLLAPSLSPVGTGSLVLIALALVARLSCARKPRARCERCLVELEDDGLRVRRFCRPVLVREGPLLAWTRCRCCLGCDHPFAVYTLIFSDGPVRIGTPEAPASFVDGWLQGEDIEGLLSMLGQDGHTTHAFNLAWASPPTRAPADVLLDSRRRVGLRALGDHPRETRASSEGVVTGGEDTRGRRSAGLWCSP